MHVSLDSALGRQRRLNSVGESVLQIAPNAAAAYSLRSLTGGDPTVVRVRRGSDNHEQDFTASEVSAGALTSFVNAQVVAPLDIQALEADGRTGDFLIAKAAYSLRSLGTRQATLAATGDTVARADGKFVCQVRRSSDDAVKSFTADEVTNGTLHNFCLNDDADIISFADAGLAGSPAADKRMYFDGVNDSVSLGSNVVLAGDFEIESKLLLQSYDIVGFSFPCLVGNGSTNRLFFSSGGTTLIFDGTNTAFGGVILPLNKLTTVKLKRTGTTVELFFDGVSKGTTTNSASFTIAFLGSRETTAGLINGFIYDLSITSGGTLIHSYKGYGNTSADWEDQTGSNDGTVAGSPALFTGQGFDGFVKTWYDQSVTNEAGDTATGNHATQATAASQPKIVSAGALLADGLDFDGTDDKLATTSAISSTNVAIVSVSKSDVNSTGAIFSMLDNFNDGHEVLYLANNVRYALEDSDLDVSSTPTNKNLYFANYDGSTQAISINGTNSTQSVSKTVDTITSVAQIGSRLGGNFLNGSIEELIVYTSDQSENRTAIEANIGEAYTIDLPSGVDPGFDQVDGFVETWYDQSGNSNDATQTTAGSQPKIVSAGSLVRDSNGHPEINFGGSSFLVKDTFTQGDLAQANTIFNIAKLDVAADENRKIYDGTLSATKRNMLFLSTNGSGEFAFFADDVISTGVTATNDKKLFSALFNGASSELFIDGALGASGDVGDYPMSGITIGKNHSGDLNFWLGQIQEIIIYNTDQSDNRVALETNINSQYSIF